MTRGMQLVYPLTGTTERPKQMEFIAINFISSEIRKRNEFFMVGKFGGGGVAGWLVCDQTGDALEIISFHPSQRVSNPVLCAFHNFLMIFDGIWLKSAVEWRGLSCGCH